MNTLTYGTVGLLFPAISLLMLAYTNRFLGLASLVRNLISKYHDKPNDALLAQIESLSLRLTLIRHTQALGVLSLIFCVGSLVALFFETDLLGKLSFAIALACMLASLLVSLREIQLSVRALQIEIAGMRPAEGAKIPLE